MAGNPIITCPECQKKFKGKEDLQGKKIRCPFCKAAFVVPPDGAITATPPQAKEAPPSVLVAAPANPEPPPAPPDDDLDINPYGATDQDLAYRCPNCANEMENKDATICLFCGYNTLTREWGRTEKTLAATGGQHFMHLLPGMLSLAWAVIVIMILLYYCVVVPDQVRGSWLFWLDHESLRMWSIIIGMGMVWGSAFYAYRRLIIEPKPAEVKND